MTTDQPVYNRRASVCAFNMDYDRKVRVKYPDGDTEEVSPFDTGKIYKRLTQAASPETVPVALYGVQEPLTCDSTVTGVPLNTLYGQHVVRRSLVHLFMGAASRALSHHHFVLRHSMSYSWYFRSETDVTEDEVKAIDTEMRSIVEKCEPFKIYNVRYDEALTMFTSRGDTATVDLLRLRSEPAVTLVEHAGFSDLYVSPVVPDAHLLTVFELLPYHGGVLVRFANHRTPLVLDPFVDNPVLVRTHEEQYKWATQLGIQTVGQINQMIARGEPSVRELIQLCDINQERYIGRVADAVPNGVRLLLIAGPSSSGKTTFARKLCIHLRCRGFAPLYMGCDDFYLNHEQTPRCPDGSLDFECVEALDLPYLNKFLTEVLRGDSVQMPEFNFKTGKRVMTNKYVQLPSNGVLVMEGIHALNPRLTEMIPSDKKFRIFISPIASVTVADRHCLSTSDNRMVRRMVRDFKYRGHSAIQTLSMWEGVRVGEDRNIYCFQNEADVVMNSALNYELGVLGRQAIPLLRSVPPTDPGYPDAHRVLSLLEMFLQIDEKTVPNTSILQEFLGIQYLFA